MRSQAVLIASYLASVVMVMLIMFYFTTVLPYTSTYNKPSTAMIDVYKIIESRGNWTALELADAIARAGSFDYVNVTITSYNILRNNTVVYRDSATYMPVGVNLSSLVITRYTYSILYLSGIYTEYLVEVGHR